MGLKLIHVSKRDPERGMDGIRCITFVLSAGHIWNSLYFTLLTLLRLKCVFSGWIDDPCLWRFSPGAGVLCHGEDYDRWDDIRNVTSSCDVIIQIMALCFPTLSMIHNRWAYYLWRHQTILPVILFFAIIAISPVYMMTSSNGSFFPGYRSFVRGIHRSPVNSPHKGSVMRTLMWVSISWSTRSPMTGDLGLQDVHVTSS